MTYRGFRVTPESFVTADSPASYEPLPALSDVYLEDSYVLGIESDDRSVRFSIDLALTPEHPAYESPPPDEQYCYRRARISIDDARSVRWRRKTMQPFTDATGEVDYGSIDSWTLDGDVSHVEGEWGEVEVAGGDVSVALDPE